MLDIACGSGYGSYLLKILGAREVTGVDRDPATVEFARATYAAEGLAFHAGDAASAPAGSPWDGPFDVIVSFETVEHVDDSDAFLEGVKKRLAPDGLFLISCPHDARSPWPSPLHLRHFTYPEFRDLVARHFPDPLPMAQIHGIASLILPLEAAEADDLAPHPLPETYFDFAKPIEESDVFLLVCGRPASEPRATAVITKNLSEMLQEVYSAVHYLRDRLPKQLEEANAAIQRQSRELFVTSRALDDQKVYSAELLHNLDAIYYSRTWQLMLACREALRSPGKLARLPARIAQILTRPPGPPRPPGTPAKPAEPGVLAQFRPHRRSAIREWTADQPLVTIGIPCFNYGRFVREAISSVLASSFQDFEIIVVNDGSTEAETLAVLTELERHPPDPRVRVAHQSNQGLAAARNKGAALARGKYVVSLDADDRIAPTYLEKALWVLEQHPEHAFCYSLVQLFDAEEKLWKTKPFDLEQLLHQNHVATAAMFRREAWIEAGGFRDGLYGQDDWNFWITLGAKGWNGYRIEEPLFFYRRHETSMWSKLQMEERERIAERIREMHAYLTGAGDSSEAEAFGWPQDPVVRAAIDQPEPEPPPSRSPLPRRRHRPFSDGRPGLLFVIPWMSIGGAEQVVLQVMQEIGRASGRERV